MEKEPRPPEPAEPSARPEPVEGRAEAAEGAARAEPLEAQTLEEQLAKAREDAQKYLANWQRAEADFQNYKRRAEQERDETRRFGLASLIINLLPILDDFERAFGSLDARLAGLTWFDGGAGARSSRRCAEFTWPGWRERAWIEEARGGEAREVERLRRARRRVRRGRPRGVGAQGR